MCWLLGERGKVGLVHRQVRADRTFPTLVNCILFIALDILDCIFHPEFCVLWELACYTCSEVEARVSFKVGSGFEQGLADTGYRVSRYLCSARSPHFPHRGCNVFFLFSKRGPTPVPQEFWLHVPSHLPLHIHGIPPLLYIHSETTALFACCFCRFLSLALVEGLLLSRTTNRNRQRGHPGGCLAAPQPTGGPTR